MKKNLKNKKALSPMIGYVLLVVFTIIISIIVYQWLGSYVPEDELKCPEQTSVLIKNLKCETFGEEKQITISLKNTGNFNLHGYFIRATQTPEQEIGSVDLSKYFDEGATKILGSENLADQHGESMKFVIELEPNQEKTNLFYVDNSDDAIIDSIEIIPYRFQKYKSKNKFVTCGEAKVLQKLNCEVGD